MKCYRENAREYFLIYMRTAVDASALSVLNNFDFWLPDIISVLTKKKQNMKFCYRRGKQFVLCTF